MMPGSGNPYAPQRDDRIKMFLFTFIQFRRVVHQGGDLQDMWEPFTAYNIARSDADVPPHTPAELATEDGAGSVKIPAPYTATDYTFHHNPPFAWVRRCRWARIGARTAGHAPTPTQTLPPGVSKPRKMP